jgi:hypothetical protein
VWVRSTAALIVVSILMGLNYLLLEAPAYPERSIHFFYGVSAGSVFLVAQVAGLVDLWKRRPGFIRWIVPPALYLLAIGPISFFGFGRALPLATDTGRAVLLLAFSAAAHAELRKAAR